jgi:hypothetical protein
MIDTSCVLKLFQRGFVLGSLVSIFTFQSFLIRRNDETLDYCTANPRDYINFYAIKVDLSNKHQQLSIPCDVLDSIKKNVDIKLHLLKMSR